MAKPSTSLLKRRLDIAEIVRKNGEIKVDDLAEMLAVSGVTIRNDLNYLEQQGYLKRSFGGAIYTAQPVAAAHLYEPAAVYTRERSHELELAKQIARLVEDNDTLFVGSGDVLRKALAFLGDNHGLCLVVNDLAHVPPARDYVTGELILLGGVVGQRGQTLEGEMALQSLRQCRPTRCLLMVDHLSENGTLNVTSESAAEVLAEAMKLAEQCVVVVAKRPVYDEPHFPLGNLRDVSAVVMPQIVAAEYHASFLNTGLSNSYTNNECLTWINPNLLSAK